MEPRLQRRVQRYGWDLAAASYESLWRAQLACVQDKLLECAALAPGQHVLDVACGTGLVAFAAAKAVGRDGRVVGVDLSGRMVEVARMRARHRNVSSITFARMDAEALEFPDATFDTVVCALGLQYMPDPGLALREMRRVLRPGGRVSLAVWGERSRCSWAGVFPIVAAEVESGMCPLFFRLGENDTLARLCAEQRLTPVEQHRMASTLRYADASDACNAALAGGPVALAWSRFGDDVRARVRRRYKEAIAPWRRDRGYRIPGEFVIVAATASATATSGSVIEAAHTC
ncbi:MAG: methyltransferase domain-containing protein [Casimicrobiaceae bacterium]